MPAAWVATTAWPDAPDSWAGIIVLAMIGGSITAAGALTGQHIGELRRDRADLGAITDRLDFPPLVTVNTAELPDSSHLWLRIRTTPGAVKVERDANGTVEVTLDLTRTAGQELQVRLGQVLDSHYQGDAR
ncbi:hypothetical protein D5S17_35485 [Pseudonocardiaceae bacterium YIM PH 21723]|nr:hypothetical protein D5S17_35485 [Pseudonocardiaceae bacterium YIM PH 21723]